MTNKKPAFSFLHFFIASICSTREEESKSTKALSSKDDSLKKNPFIQQTETNTSHTVRNESPPIKHIKEEENNKEEKYINHNVSRINGKIKQMRSTKSGALLPHVYVRASVFENNGAKNAKKLRAKFGKLQKNLRIDINPDLIKNREMSKMHFTKSLVSMNLNYKFHKLYDSKLKKVSLLLKYFKRLNRFSINLFQQNHITDKGAVGVFRSLKRCKQLKSLEVNVGYCFGLTSRTLERLASSIKGIKSLTHVNLNFPGWGYKFGDKRLEKISLALGDYKLLTNYYLNSWNSFDIGNDGVTVSCIKKNS